MLLFLFLMHEDKNVTVTSIKEGLHIELGNNAQDSVSAEGIRLLFGNTVVL